tara:strand:+ start:3340 stop:4440 length:1101 start_codon:yes stop_codon:yes gene_type:complete
MRLFNLIKKTPATTASLLLLISGVSFANPIGEVREASGVNSILRDKETIQTETIELYDQAQTAKGRMLIEFLDKAELQLKEHSLVLIDEIYYDPNPNLSKMSLKMAMGTARFASGKLGLVNNANISIQTPTATIAVRGTDFTTTIDELGRSLVILLPDDKGDPSGVIEVSNAAGTVTLDQAYAATMVTTTDSPPTSSTVITGITPALIDNMFIVNPPAEVKQRIEEELKDEQNEDQGLLDIDFLEFTELEEDELAEDELDEFSELDIDELDVEFLLDFLAIVDSGDLFDTLGEFDIKGARRGLNDESQFNVFLRDGNLVLYRNVNGLIEIEFAAGGSFTLDTTTPGYQGIITGNDGEDIMVIINQN